MKKLIGIIILILFFSCKQKENQEKIIKALETTETIKSKKTETEYSEDMPTDMEYLNHNENIPIVIDTLKIKHNELYLFFIRKTFEPEKHKLDKSKLTIDGENFFGTDGDFPTYKLSEAYVEMNGQRISLETSKMYNPWFGNGNVFHHQIILNKKNSGILIFGTFSDGAGFYGAEWIVNKNSSKRLELSTDENFTFKYDEE